MNIILKDAIMILSGLVGGYLLIRIRQFILKKGVETVKDNFDTSKLTKGLLSVSDRVLWAKDFTSLFNIRKLVIYGLIIGIIFGYGWYRGRLGAPVQFDLQGKEAIIQLNEHYLKIEKDGTANVVDKDGKILKQIKVKDIPGLREKLRPYRFKLEPIVIAGGSIGESGAGIEGGVGVSWFKYYKTNLDSFLTNRGIYPLGVSYSITDNSGVGLGAGMGYKADKRGILYYYWKF